MYRMKGWNRELLHEPGPPVQYGWNLDGSPADVNEWLGRRVRISFLGLRRCIACGRPVKKLYQNGYCFPCVTTLAETDLCMVKPHECHLHRGTCRDEQFAATHCSVPHLVYLGISSHAKVGVTRKGREITRWLDQGAVRATVIAEVPARKDAGELEVEVSGWLSDKTDWRKMVRGQIEESDLDRLAEEVTGRLSARWLSYIVRERTIQEFVYPVLPGREPKAKRLSPEQAPGAGTLIGVRGQYLLFEDGVVNVRKHAGMLLDVET